MLAESVEAANLKSDLLMLKPFSSAQELLHKYDLDVFFDVVRAIKEAGTPRQCLARGSGSFSKSYAHPQSHNLLMLRWKCGSAP